MNDLFEIKEHECRGCGKVFCPDFAIIVGGSGDGKMITVLCPRCGVGNRVEDSRRKEHGETERV